MLHNTEKEKYKALYDSGHAITFQVYTNRCKNQHEDIQKIDECIYQSMSGKVIYMPWATDLLPHQIDKMKEKVVRDWGQPKKRVVYWIGTIWDGFHGNREQINPFKNECEKAGIKFQNLTNVSPKENRNLTYNSY